MDIGRNVTRFNSLGTLICVFLLAICGVFFLFFLITAGVEDLEILGSTGWVYSLIAGIALCYVIARVIWTTASSWRVHYSSEVQEPLVAPPAHSGEDEPCPEPSEDSAPKPSAPSKDMLQL